MREPLPRVRFGHTDLWVSRLCQGTAFRHLPRASDPRSLEVLRYCLEAGINFFDTAHAYGWGGAEEMLGQAIAGRRSEVVICTKVPASLPPEQEGTPSRPARFSREYLFSQLDNSLRRLRTEYVDLYLLHQPDGHTPPSEIAASMQELVHSGKIRYWGLSNHRAAQVQAYVELSTQQAPMAGVEEYYNIAGAHLDEEGCSRVRLFEEEMLPLLRRTGLGCLAFSPLDTGHLASESPVQPPLAGLIKAIDQVAADLEVPRAAVCVAWVLHHPEITCALAGCESREQIHACLAGTQLALPAQALDALDQARKDFRKEQEKVHQR
jgi:aryl-alcohol dehydrogenase-like predicted oxidoreductase